MDHKSYDVPISKKEKRNYLVMKLKIDQAKVETITVMTIVRKMIPMKKHLVFWNFLLKVFLGFFVVG